MVEISTIFLQSYWKFLTNEHPDFNPSSAESFPTENRENLHHILFRRKNLFAKNKEASIDENEYPDFYPSFAVSFSGGKS